MSRSAQRGVSSALAILFIVNLLAAVDRTALAAVLPAIKQDLVLSDTQLGFLTGIAFSAFYAVFGLPLASWADRHNRRNTLWISVLFWSLATAATGLRWVKQAASQQPIRCSANLHRLRAVPWYLQSIPRQLR
jgi:MFS family permease